LFSGLGGNRKLWKDSEVDVTSVEMNPDIAAVYRDLYTKDTVVVGDAHQYLLDHFNEFDYVWSSPPCQSHSSFRQNIGVRYRGTVPLYPDMMLYQQILFLQYNFKGKWAVENVRPYYTPLIKPTAILQRHYFWSNYELKKREFKSDNIRNSQIPDLQKLHGIDLSKYKIKNKRQILRNCVSSELGEYVFNERKEYEGTERTDTDQRG